MKYIYKVAIVATVIFQGCAKDNVLETDAGPVADIEYITVSLDAEEPETRTTYVMEDGLLKTSWAEGDVVAVTPDLYKYLYAGTYKVTDPGSSSGVFQRVTSVTATGSTYGVFYPGSKIKSTAQFTRFTYTGQVQKKDDPMGHIGAYHSMRTSTTDYSNINFSGADQSSCMKLTLKGMTFHNPVKIEVDVAGASRFYNNNSVSGNYTYYTIDAPTDLTSVSSISLELEGYGDESSIEAWIMMSNNTVTLRSGDDLRVFVYQEDGKRYVAHIPITQTVTLSGGNWHNLKVKNGWTQASGDFAKYDWDGEVVTLQEGIEGLDLVIMGDGFIKEDFDDGTYESIMRQAYDEFFSVEPLKSIKKDFCVYYVKAVSPERTDAVNTGANGAINSGTKTKFSTVFTANSTSLTGDNDLVREFAMKAFSTNASARIQDATIVVMVNQKCRAGTCHNSWYSNNGYDYGRANAVAYCALGRYDSERRSIMQHEICGHGFGKLADEYYYTTTGSLSTSLWTTLDSYHSLGLYRNVDKYIDSSILSQLSSSSYQLTTTSNVYWHDLFDTSNNYESSSVESLGVFKGGYTYSFMFCRPTQNASKSIMNSDGEYFNAVCRRQIFYRYLRLSKTVTSNVYGTESELQRFLEFDAETFLSDNNGSSTSFSSQNAPLVDEYFDDGKSFSPMVLIDGTWDEQGHFTPYPVQ